MISPRLGSWSIWCFLGILAGTICLAGVRVPAWVQGPGAMQLTRESREWRVVGLLPASAAARIEPGRPLRFGRSEDRSAVAQTFKVAEVLLGPRSERLRRSLQLKEPSGGGPSTIAVTAWVEPGSLPEGLSDAKPGETLQGTVWVQIEDETLFSLVWSTF